MDPGTIIYREPAMKTSDHRQIPERAWQCRVREARSIDSKYVILEVIGPPELLAERPKNKPPKTFSVTKETLRVLQAASSEAVKASDLERENAELRAKLAALQGSKPEPAPAAGIDPADVTVGDEGGQGDAFSTMTKAELLNLAAERGVTVSPKASKDKIIAALKAA